jgi:hypothetical protein
MPRVVAVRTTGVGAGTGAGAGGADGYTHAAGSRHLHLLCPPVRQVCVKLIGTCGISQSERGQQPLPVVRVVGVRADPTVRGGPEPGKLPEPHDGLTVEAQQPVAAERRADPPTIHVCVSRWPTAGTGQLRRGRCRRRDGTDRERRGRQTRREHIGVVDNLDRRPRFARERPVLGQQGVHPAKPRPPAGVDDKGAGMDPAHELAALCPWQVESSPAFGRSRAHAGFMTSRTFETFLTTS